MIQWVLHVMVFTSLVPLDLTPSIYQQKVESDLRVFIIYPEQTWQGNPYVGKYYTKGQQSTIITARHYKFHQRNLYGYCVIRTD